jgi:hypothetical protein
MYGIVLEYRTGHLVEAVVLRLTADEMRVVPRGCRDAVELRRIGAEWIDEAGEAIALGFLAPMGVNSETQLLARRAS